MSTAIQYLQRNIRSEILKSRRSATSWLTIIGALFVPIVYCIVYLSYPEKMVPGPGANPWERLLAEEWMFVSFLLLPFYIILVGTLLGQTEHKANAWKQLLAEPVPRYSIYFGKLGIVLLTVAICYILFVGSSIVVGYFVGWVHPQLGFWKYTPPVGDVAVLVTRLYLVALPIMALHTWLGIRFKNFVLPAGIGLVMIIASLIMIRGWEYQYVFPYTYPTLTLNAKSTGSLYKHEYWAIGYFLLFSLLGYVDFLRKKDA
ncbi:hypothetical protein LX64_01172 [Chitinophaga skermanii]|uniref:ABC-2 family transporter n=1 Tax=Chitinophaga skermanii TaxID=331697 RepID=A0A327QV78_9BACT|nr:ABC transporter permease [Chitinophaga skermanii]RAJ08519.1 hypothetical protein LX64_01172 [Chitinophaga skermanii]